MTSRAGRTPLHGAWICAVAAPALCATLADSPGTTAASRSFDLTCQVRMPDSGAGAGDLKIWIPVPQSDRHQTIGELQIESPVAFERRRDPEYGNEYLFLRVPESRASAAATVRVAFRATRYEHRVAFGANAVASRADPAALRRFLRPDGRVPVAGLIADVSAQQTRGIGDPLAKAQAIYDYVIANMRYDKSGTGWGHGDAIWACTSKRGNCTDFHSLFIGMIRAAGIPARFEIGFPVPADRHEGVIPGYHCWAQFYVEPYGWIPVDVSEAWKHPDRKAYYFGAHDDNRVLFTIGRDIPLDPAQQGAPLNYFIYPYAERDGRPVAVESTLSFRDRSGAGD